MRLLFVFYLYLSTTVAFGQIEYSYQIISNELIALRIIDGKISHPELGQVPWKDGRVTQQPVELLPLRNKQKYMVSSTNDLDYLKSKSPISVSLKRKGIDFLDRDTLDIKINYIINEYEVYLVLPYKLKENFDYNLSFSVQTNGKCDVQAFNFLYTAKKNRSDLIHINQLGFPIISKKLGYLSHWLGDGGSYKLTSFVNKPFFLMDENEEVAYKGLISKTIHYYDTSTLSLSNNLVNADVLKFDFSSFQKQGTYKIFIPGIGHSYPFTVSNNSYVSAYYTVLRGLFHHRSGIERERNNTAWVKDIDHRPGYDGFEITYSKVRNMDCGNCFDGLPASTTSYSLPDNPAPWMDIEQWGWGGYFDAGDFDRRSDHIIVSEFLLNVFLKYSKAFGDNELDIPESGNGLPDILDEALWGLSFFRNLRGPTGGISGGVEASGHPKPGENSVTDTNEWFVYAEEPLASLRLSSALATLSKVYESLGDEERAILALEDAEFLYNWSLKEKGIERCSQEQLRASASLYRSSLKHKYLKDAIGLINAEVSDQLGEYYLVQSLGENHGITRRLREEQIKQSMEIINFAKKSQLPLIMPEKSGWDTYNFLSNCTQLIITYWMTNNPMYLSSIQFAVDYSLGANPLNKVFVTGLGSNPINEVFNIDSWYDNIDQSIPGIIPYGFTKNLELGNKLSVWNPYAVFNNVYPHYTQWPIGELFFENRYLINCNEYTVHETLGPAAFVYSFMHAISKSNSKSKVLLNNNEGN